MVLRDWSLMMQPLLVNNVVVGFAFSPEQGPIKKLIVFLSPGQTIATCQRNISKHCWAQLCKNYVHSFV